MKLVFSFFIFAAITISSLAAQGNNPVVTNSVAVSSVRISSISSTQAIIEVRLSGRGAETVEGGEIYLSGPCIPGGSATLVAGQSRQIDGPGVEEVILSAAFIYARTSATGPETVGVGISLRAFAVNDNRKIYSDIGGISTTYMTWNP